MVEEIRETGSEQENGAPLTFDDILEDKTFQSEFDKRVAKALETAKTKWAREAEAAKAAAITDATSKLDAEVTRAMIQTELVRAKARDVDVVLPLIDTAKVTRGENGLEGLAEQIEALKTGKAYLFESEAKPEAKPAGKSGLNHDESSDDADDAKIRRIMGLPTKKG